MELRREDEPDLRLVARLRRAATRPGGAAAVGASLSDGIPESFIGNVMYQSKVTWLTVSADESWRVTSMPAVSARTG